VHEEEIMTRFSRWLATLLATASVSAAVAATRFDGNWSVTATVDDGGCTGPYRYPIVIRDGVVDDAGGSGVDASGRAGADGRIVGTIRNGPASVAVEGRLRVSEGQGVWTLSGPVPCSGRWTSRKTG
jgi:hypothetical protein